MLFSGSGVKLVSAPPVTPPPLQVAKVAYATFTWGAFLAPRLRNVNWGLKAPFYAYGGGTYYVLTIRDQGALEGLRAVKLPSKEAVNPKVSMPQGGAVHQLGKA